MNEIDFSKYIGKSIILKFKDRIEKTYVIDVRGKLICNTNYKILFMLEKYSLITLVHIDDFTELYFNYLESEILNNIIDFSGNGEYSLIKFNGFEYWLHLKREV